MSFIHEHVQHAAPSHLYEVTDGWSYPQPSALEEYYQPPIPDQSLGTPATTPELSYMHHSQMPILQPAPTPRVDVRYLETASHSPEMTVLHTPQLPHRGQPATWVQTPEYEYVSYEALQPSHGTYIEYIHVTPPGPYSYYGIPPSHHVLYESGYVSHPSYSQIACGPRYYSHRAPVPGYIAPSSSQTMTQPSYVPYTPAPSNHSSGTSTPQEEYSTLSEYRNDGTEALNTPVTPSTGPKVPWLLLGQPDPTQSSVQPYQTIQHPHAEAISPEQSPIAMASPARSYYAHPTHHETPLSPISPIVHDSAHPDVFHSAPETVKVEPSVVEDTSPAEEANPIVSVDTAATMSQAEQRLKKLRDRRHVIACMFCRGRKIACHSTPKEDKTGVTSDAVNQDDDYKPTGRGSKRAIAAATKPPCDNCFRRGRECVYPPRVVGTSRRRRKEPRDQSPFNPDFDD